jgi:hypothetical protein
MGDVKAIDVGPAEWKVNYECNEPRLSSCSGALKI